ncbi:hypothetical protein FKW77_004399 [Venturia effusa]|uniref:Uncharacterized protein n=1 Tax=Venturia effusa TaxID=50376 RepID=A0A517LNS7_9PEZI|nr:hypothetical protein FKW77_004399 [Venturia effusa]
MVNLSSRPPQPRKSSFAYGSCTHITMDMVYDQSAFCDVCHRPANLGFLYRCNQDVYIKNCAKKYLDEYPDEDAIETSPTAQLRAINMSISVISQFEQGDVYTQAQIDTLKSQKSHMLTVVDKHKASLPTVPQCNLKCCPACRPYLKDRVPYSFGAVFANEVAAVVPEEEQLPVKRADKMLELGLRIPPNPPMLPISNSSAETSDSDDISISSDECDHHDDDDHERSDEKEDEIAKRLNAKDQERRRDATTDLDGSDGAAITEESVETATVVPDIVQV